jgi:hypothetical protein
MHVPTQSWLFYIYYHLMINYGSKHVVEVSNDTFIYLHIVLAALQFIKVFTRFISRYGIIA